MENRTPSLTKNPRLKYYDDSANHKFARQISRNFVWEKSADGKNKIVAPQLPEIKESKKVKFGVFEIHKLSQKKDLANEK